MNAPGKNRAERKLTNLPKKLVVQALSWVSGRFRGYFRFSTINLCYDYQNGSQLKQTRRKDKIVSAVKPLSVPSVIKLTCGPADSIQAKFGDAKPSKLQVHSRNHGKYGRSHEPAGWPVFPKEPTGSFRFSSLEAGQTDTRKVSKYQINIILTHERSNR